MEEFFTTLEQHKRTAFWVAVFIIIVVSIIANRK